MNTASRRFSDRGLLPSVIASFVLAACGGGSPAPPATAASAVQSASPQASVAPSSPSLAPSSAVPTSPPPSTPSGVIAMGHSGLTGEGTGGPSQAVPDNSWATGSNPEVNSVYWRLHAVRPELAGTASNQAHGAANANELRGMTEAALGEVPRPALAIIQTIDNDIHCDGSDPGHVPELGASVKEALDAIRAASPETRILLVGQAGRPSVPFVKLLIAHDPSVVPSLTGSGMCDFLDADGQPVTAHFAALTKIIDAYEAEQARVCATVPHCVTDGGVRAKYVDVLENFSPDWAHFNVRGQAAQAKLIWPVVEKLLEL